jgi:DNA-binding NtrC family response regulator
MHNLLNLQQSDIMKAWFVYVHKNIILEEKLRPVIARSWRRGPNLSYNMLKPLERMSKEQIKQLSQRHADLTAVAAPLMEYLLAIDRDRIIILCNQEGYTLKALHNYEKNIVDYTCYHESAAGCNTAGIILEEGVPAGVVGYEHLTANWHSVVSGGIPLRDSSQKIIGALTIGYPFNKRPKTTFESIEALGSLVTGCLESRGAFRYEASPEMTRMLDCSTSPLLLLNGQGTVVNADAMARRAFGLAAKGPDDSIKKYATAKGLEPAGILRTPSGHKLKIADITEINSPDGEPHRLVRVELPPACRLNPQSRSLPVSAYSEETSDISELIGHSQPILALKSRISRLRNVQSTVLIQGESGTGKELVAQAIYNNQGPFIVVNCGSIPKELVESELFGYASGSFTGGLKQGKPGKFELAKGGTIFLDEIGEMPYDSQATLLRVLESKSFSKIGSSKQIKLDSRIIAATNKDLAQEVRRGAFREDLYYRLNVININTPALREILEDIPFIADHFLAMLCAQFNLEKMELDNSAIALLSDYGWPGNGRELRNIIERAVVYSTGEIISSDIIRYCLSSNALGTRLQIFSARPGAAALYENLQKNGWNVAQTARFMGLSRNKLYALLKENDIHWQEAKAKA